MSTALLSESASNLGNLISIGRLDPVELTELYLNAIKEEPLTERIYSKVTWDRARIEAKKSSERMKSGMRNSILDGVPISWKDLFDTADVSTEAGTDLLKGRVPSEDAEVVRNAAKAGFI